MEAGKFVEALEELNKLKDEGIIDQNEYEEKVNELKKQYSKANNYYGKNFSDKTTASKARQNNAIALFLLVIAVSIFGIWFFTSPAFKNITNIGNNVVNEYEDYTNLSNGYNIRSEFKYAMDSYENTMNAYIEFMVNYTNSNGTKNPQLLKEYSEWLKRYLDTLDAFKKWKEKDLNLEEAKYYVDVQKRVSQKFLDASVEMKYR